MEKSRLSALVCALALALPAVASGEAPAVPSAQRVMSNPPVLEMIRPLSRDTSRRGPGGEAAPSREAKLDLNVTFTAGRIFNPATGVFDNVNLRSYQGTRVDPQAPYVSPTLAITPGDTIRITLNNKLPYDESCILPGPVNSPPHCANGTNLHAHGLWVNPAGNGDNVLVKINPGVSFQYEYNVAADHPAGTFWYHTHLHGSTALQVASGMAGALIIRGSRPPSPTENGDLDTLLDPRTFEERILVFQQIQYACYDAEGKVKRVSDTSKAYRCDPGDVGEIPRSYAEFGPSGWRDSGRYTSINGRVLPIFDDAETGQIERWRVVHGGIRDTVNLEFRELKANAPDPAGLTAEQQDAFVGQSCTGDPLPQHLVAADGLTMAAVTKTTNTIFQPAYRFDSLMVFPKAATYCVIDAAAPSVVNNAAPSRQLLGLVRVKPGRALRGDVTSYLTDELIGAARRNLPANVRDAVIGDLRNGLKLSKFVPHQDLQSYPNPGQQNLFFNIGAAFTIGDATADPPYDRPYDPARIDRTLILDTVDEWTLTSKLASHPFHIHVNPFQVVKILDPNGKDVSLPDAVDDYGGTVDTQYRGTKGLWKDTLWVKAVRDKDGVWHGYQVVVRSKYQRYIGDFVLHCHILDHEDQGMMQNIRIALSDGKGGSAHGHH